MTLREEARRLAEEASEYKSPASIREIESALLAFAKLVLEREPSAQAQRIAAQLPASQEVDGAIMNAYIHGVTLKWKEREEECPMVQQYRAMTAQLLKELEEK